MIIYTRIFIYEKRVYLTHSGFVPKSLVKKDHHLSSFIMCYNHHKNNNNCTVIYSRINRFCHQSITFRKNYFENDYLSFHQVV